MNMVIWRRGFKMYQGFIIPSPAIHPTIYINLNKLTPFFGGFPTLLIQLALDHFIENQGQWSQVHFGRMIQDICEFCQNSKVPSADTVYHTTTTQLATHTLSIDIIETMSLILQFFSSREAVKQIIPELLRNQQHLFIVKHTFKRNYAPYMVCEIRYKAK